MRIRGAASARPQTVEHNLPRFNPHPRFATEMVPALWVAAERYGVDPVVIVAQAAHETGWGNYGGVVGPERHNTCGLKTRAGGSDTDPNAHAVFPDWQTGARAHAQHLLAYCQVAVPDADIVDPRWVWVYGRKPAITDVEQLSGSWAPSSTYGTRVADTAAKLKEGASLVAYMPGFEWVGGPRASGSTYIDGVPWRICLHTTETPPISRGGNPRGMAATHSTPPHVWYDWEADQGWQSVTLDRGAAALWNDGNPQTNRARCLQVELIGYAEEAGSWPAVAHERIAARVVKPLIDFVQSQGGSIDLTEVAVPLPGPIPNSASEYAPQRLSAEQWLNGPIGLCSHRHVPRNDHWDAGALDLRRIAALAGGKEMDDVGVIDAGQWNELVNKLQDIRNYAGGAQQQGEAANNRLDGLRPILEEARNLAGGANAQGEAANNRLDGLGAAAAQQTERVLAAVRSVGGEAPDVDVEAVLRGATVEQLSKVFDPQMLIAAALAAMSNK